MTSRRRFLSQSIGIIAATQLPFRPAIASALQRDFDAVDLCSLFTMPLGELDRVRVLLDIEAESCGYDREWVEGSLGCVERDGSSVTFRHADVLATTRIRSYGIRVVSPSQRLIAEKSWNVGPQTVDPGSTLKPSYVLNRPVVLSRQGRYYFPVDLLPSPGA